MEIKGYRKLSQAEIDLVNEGKDLAEKVAEYVAKLDDNVSPLSGLPSVDPRWLSIGRTHLQQGFMALTRAITRPQGF